MLKNNINQECNNFLFFHFSEDSICGDATASGFLVISEEFWEDYKKKCYELFGQKQFISWNFQDERSLEFYSTKEYLSSFKMKKKISEETYKELKFLFGSERSLNGFNNSEHILNGSVPFFSVMQMKAIIEDAKSSNVSFEEEEGND